jgi:hypothetical protein
MPEPGPARRLPAWLRIVAVGGGVVLVVGLVALVGLLVPPVGEAIQRAPVVVVVLVVGTVLVLGTTIRAALRRR